MPTRIRSRTASVAVALVVMALIGAPTLAVGQGSEVTGGTATIALAKASKKPHPHATPTATPTPIATPKPTPAPTDAPARTPRPPTPMATAAPNVNPGPVETRAARSLGRGDRETPRPTKRRSGGKATAAPTATARASAPPATAAGSLDVSGAAASGPGPELIGFGAVVAGLLGLGSIRILAARRRRSGAVEADRLGGDAAAGAAGSGSGARSGAWRTLSLDDEDRLPSWLRSNAEATRADSDSPDAGPAAAWGVALPPLERGQGRPDRPPMTFSEPVGASAMRLTVGPDSIDLLDEPSETSGRAVVELAPGDEVEILDLEEPWVRIVTPEGQAGWIPSSALGIA